MGTDLFSAGINETSKRSKGIFGFRNYCSRCDWFGNHRAAISFHGARRKGYLRTFQAA